MGAARTSSTAPPSGSVSSRLSSSGILRSPLRRPASTCATGMPSLVAQSAAATVELTSPTTTTSSGPSAMGLAAAARRPVLCADWGGEALVGELVHPGGPLGVLNGQACLLYTSPSPRDGLLSRMPSSA